MRNFKIKLQDNNNKVEIRKFDAFDVFDSSLDKIERPGVFKLLLIKEIERTDEDEYYNTSFLTANGDLLVSRNRRSYSIW